MPEFVKIIVVLLIMIIILYYSRKFRTSQMRKAGAKIIKELKSKGALDASSGIELPYAQKKLIKIGFRDDRPKILKQLVQMGVVGVTENNLFYLNESEIPSEALD